MDKLNSAPFDASEDDDRLLNSADWDRLVEMLQNPETASGAAKKLRMFVVQILLSNDGGRKLRSFQRREDVDDLAQSCVRTLLRVANNYEHKSGVELRLIFCKTVKNKIHDKHRHHRQQRRDIDQEKPADEGELDRGRRPVSQRKRTSFRGSKNESCDRQADGDETPQRLDQYTTEGLVTLFLFDASPEERVTIKETIQKLPNELREVVVLTLAGYSDAEMMAKLGCCRRSIVRRRSAAKRLLQEGNRDVEGDTNMTEE